MISGVFENYSRDELKGLIKAHGGKIVSSISSSTDYVLAGDKMGPSKKEKAEKLNVEIIYIRQLFIDCVTYTTWKKSD